MSHLVSYKWFRRTQYITSMGLFYKKWVGCGGCLTRRPFDWASRQKCDLLLYVSYGVVQASAPGGLYAESHPPSLLKFIHLLHLNQSGVQDLISYLTYAQASTIWHWNGKKVAQFSNLKGIRFTQSVGMTGAGGETRTPNIQIRSLSE